MFQPPHRACDRPSGAAFPPTWPALMLCAVGLAAGCLPGAARAQVVSQGRGVLTLMVGQAGGPVGNVANEVAGGTSLPSVTQHSIGWRVAGGYNFADFLALESAITRLGYMKNSARYLKYDQVNAETALNVVELNLIGRIPLAPHLRVDLTLGLDETSLDTSLSTQNGSTLPIGQSNPIQVRRFGYDVGLDGEWMLGEHLSLILGYHLYPNVGSDSVQGSSNGRFTLLGAGMHIEF